MEYVPYNIAEGDLRLLRTWPLSASKPALFLTVPSVRDAGERDLVSDLSALSYKASGLTDTPARHRIWRNYPHEGSSEDYARFMDDPILTAEITNEFQGVDCIDLTDWLGRDLGSPLWAKLLGYVRPGRGRDYIFVAYTESDELVDELARSIVSRCGVAVLRVNVLPPSAEALAAYFGDKTDGLFEDELDVVWDWILGLHQSNKTPNFAYVATVATMARYACATWEDRREGLCSLLEQHAALAPTASKTHRIGF